MYFKMFRKSLSMNLSVLSLSRIQFFLFIISIIIFDLTLPLLMLLVYNASNGFPGWSFNEYLIFYGSFLIVMGLVQFLFINMLNRISSLVKRGSLDLLMTRPLRLITFLSISFPNFAGLIEVIIGVSIMVYGIIGAGVSFSIISLGFFLFFVILGVCFFYSLIVILSALTIIFVDISSIFHLLHTLSDVARYPLSVYGSTMKFIFSFIIPFGVMSFYPSQALLGGLTIINILGVFASVALFLGFSLFLWNQTIKRYVSVGG